jgi:plastocyanin
MVTWGPRNLLIATILIAAIVGSTTGLGVSYLARPSPSPQARDIYLFAVDQNFNSSATRGLNSDYIYSSSFIIANRGDTLTVHFYNPTDKPHSFTVGSPYSNEAIVAGMTPGNPGVIRNANVTITTSQAGSFTFYCKFHPPQMTGTILVQG